MNKIKGLEKVQDIINKLKDKECYSTFDSMLRGCGIDRRPHAFGKARALFEKLELMGIIDLGKNHSKDIGGMYLIRNWRDYKSVNECVQKRFDDVFNEK